MTKLISLLLFTVVLFSTLSAQDILTKTNGDQFSVQVLEVSVETVTYTLFGLESSPKMTIEKSDIASITYKNGVIEHFGKTLGEVSAFKRNILGIDILGLALGRVEFSYERLFSSKIGLCIPVSIAYYDTYMYDFDPLFNAGVELNYYPTGQGTVRYFCGPALRFGVVKSGFYYDPYYYSDPYYNGGNWNSEYYANDHNLFFSQFTLNNGIIITPSSSFSISAKCGLGLRYVGDYEGMEIVENFAPFADFSIKAAIRF